MKLSVVTSLYRSAPHLPEFVARASAAVGMRPARSRWTRRHQIASVARPLM